MDDGRVFTVGHSNRTLAGFLAMLGEAGIRKLVDVRRYPRSRYNPHFNDRALAPALKRVGIGYRHAPELGGMRDAPAAESLNDGWEPGPFRNYADYALTADFQDALAVLEEEARSAPVAIMCAEKDWRQCHRQIISDYLLNRGHVVFHLTSPEVGEAASLDQRAQRLEDGVLHYRPPPVTQYDLF